MKLLADFRSRVLSAKVKKAVEEEEDGENKVNQEPAVQSSGIEQTAASNEDW